MGDIYQPINQAASVINVNVPWTLQCIMVNYNSIFTYKIHNLKRKMADKTFSNITDKSDIWNAETASTT